MALVTSLALVVSLFPPIAARADAAPGRWFSTGPMVVPRWALTLTALGDGRALAAGGFLPGGITPSAELYDPVTRTWSATGPLALGRAWHTATRLLDGRVLIAGGSLPPWPTYTNAAELYDPATGLFTPTGPMTRARMEHTATLLQDGRVLIAGNTGDGSEATAELYEPSTGTFSPTGSMNYGRNTNVAALLPSGKVLVAGGTAGRDGRATELYDPVTGTWSLTGDMNLARDHFAAVVLPLSPGDERVPPGKVLIAGGRIPGGAATARAELYDPSTGSWSETVPMNVPRWGFGMVVANELGYVPVAGGTNDGTVTSLSAAELYYGEGWAMAGPLNEARTFHRMVLLSLDHGPLVAGGYDYSGGAPAQSGEVQNPPPPPLPTRKEQCKDDGWKTFGVFKTQGDCVAFVATKGKNGPAR